MVLESMIPEAHLALWSDSVLELRPAALLGVSGPGVCDEIMQIHNSR